MHAKTDSDATSFDPYSPKRTGYYVLSPSKDSHDGDKSSSMQATPVSNSPMNSPPSQHSYGHHSSASSATASRVSGVYTSASLGKKVNHKTNDKGWPESKVIEEEGEYGEFYQGSKGLSRRTQVFVAVIGFIAIFCLFCLIIWGASRPYKPKLSVKSLTLHNFNLGEGSDLTGVPTKMLTVNCSIKMTVHNPATFFGIHVSSKSVNLMYSDITVATGELKKYYQQRKSHWTVSVNMQGSKVPLYGAGASFAGLVNTEKIPMMLVFEVRSQGDVVGKLVRSKHTQHVSCSVAIDSHNNNPIKLKDSLCTYS